MPRRVFEEALSTKPLLDKRLKWLWVKTAPTRGLTVYAMVKATTSDLNRTKNDQSEKKMGIDHIV